MIKGTILVFMLFVFFCPHEFTFAYDDLETHPDLTEKAIEKSSFDEYLLNNMGITNGIDKTYNGKTILELLKAGSTNEDDGLLRPRNHFLNPIHNTGLDDERTIWVPVVPGPILVPIPVHITGLPNLNWAMGYRLDDQGQEIETYDDCGVGDHSSDDDCNDYSWRRARNAFYEALIGPAEEIRTERFIEFYEKLGRILHLLQDVSVPAHTRNDFFGHLDLDFTEFEMGNPIGCVGNLYEFYVKQNLEECITNPQPAYSINVPVFPKLEHYWDQEVYNGADPNVTLPIAGEEQSL